MFRTFTKSIIFNQLSISKKPILMKSFSSAAPAPIDLGQYDASQTKSLDESLILVDRQDKAVGKISKVEGHLNTYNKTGLPHRAFSVFLFNQQNQLLIHQRSEKKITFPHLWTNSCCSHPLYNDEELVEENYLGARKAIRRRVEYELGHDLKDIDDLSFMGKIFYNAECDETWGENEIDYCFFIKRDFQESQFRPNPDEIQNVKWVGKDEIINYLNEKYKQNQKVTPWFGAIMHYKLFEWWNVLINEDIKSYKASNEVVNLNDYQKPIFLESNGVLKSNLTI